MTYQFLSIMSSVFTVLGYIPEIYNLSSCILFNKPYSQLSNNIIWGIWISASGLGCLYGYFINDYYVIVNCGINTGLNTTIFLLRMYKFKTNSSIITNQNIL
jgi:hypothetical protein